MKTNGRKVVRVLFQNIVDGDRRKFKAKSNDSDSGGGARDLRFRPEAKFLPFFGRMFPQKQVKTRRSNGNQTQIEVLSGAIKWSDKGQEHTAEMEIWPSTDARPGECRIAKISSFGFDDLITDDPNGGRSVFMMFQQADGTIRIHFTTETSLMNDNWDLKIKQFAADWIQEDTKSAYLDLEKSEQYPA